MTTKLKPHEFEASNIASLTRQMIEVANRIGTSTQPKREDIDITHFFLLVEQREKIDDYTARRFNTRSMIETADAYAKLVRYISH